MREGLLISSRLHARIGAVNEEILREFRRFRRRHLWVRGLDLFLEAAFALTIAAAGALLVDRMAFELGLSAPLLDSRLALSTLLGGAVALALAWTTGLLLLRPTSPARIAWQLDRASGGEERFLSAIELAASEGQGPFAAALCRDAVRVARETAPARVLPRIPVGYRWGIALSFAAGALLWAHPPRLYDAPSADFDASPLRGAAPLEAVFRDGSIGAIDEFLWDFGDGERGRGETAAHVYEKPGRYAATLEIKGPGGSSRRSREIEVLPPGRATADFEGEPIKGRGALEVRFHNLSRHAKRHLWDFGDGGRSSEVEPVHRYATPGLYTVRLRVENDLGHDERVRERYIKVAHPEEPLANFRAMPQDGEAPLEVRFEDQSEGALAEWHWDFGDLRSGAGRLSRERNPVHVYETPGHYTVRLRVKGPHGEDEEEKVRYIHVRDRGDGPGRGGGPSRDNAASKPKEAGGRLMGEKPERPKTTIIPEELRSHKPGTGLEEKELTVIGRKPLQGGEATVPVPLKDVLPQYQRAAEESIERELIPPVYRDHVRRYYGGAK